MEATKAAEALDDHFTPPTLKLWLCSRCQAPRLNIEIGESK